MPKAPPLQSHSCWIGRYRQGSMSSCPDTLAIEEPLEIRLGFMAKGQRQGQSVAITMRTPGHDRELAAGFLWTEGILTHQNQVDAIVPCGPTVDGRQNTVRVELTDGVRLNLEVLHRHFYATSSCGICGKSSLEALSLEDCQPMTAEPRPNPPPLGQPRQPGPTPVPINRRRPRLLLF